MPKATKAKAMPRFTRAPDDMVSLFEKAMQDFPTAEQRKVFGYPAAFVGGQMFTGLHGENMILRLEEGDRARFLEKFKTGLFEPMPGRPMKEYVLVPPSIYESPARLREWLAKSLAYARSLPPKDKPKKKR